MITVDKSAAHTRAAKIVGALFIFAIVMLFAGESFYKPLLDSEDFLANVYPNRISVIVGILFEFAIVPAVVLIPALLFPILKKHNEALALGYVGFRLLEAAILSIGYVNTLSLISLSEIYLKGSTAQRADIQLLGSAAQRVNQWAGTTGLIYLVVFASGSLMFYTVLYASKLVPRLISTAGLVAALLLLTGSVAGHLDLFTDTLGAEGEIIFAAPIALAEFMLSVWLIVKGFNPTAVNKDAQSA